jgi:chitodextrinase
MMFYPKTLLNSSFAVLLVITLTACGGGNDNSSNNNANDITPPTAPANLIAAAISSTQISLSWSASTDDVGVTGYRIYRNGTEIATTTDTNYSNNGLVPSTSYTYTVTAYDATGNESAPSTSASATTQDATLFNCKDAYISNPDIIFCDGFETGDLSTTNSDGFSWDGTNRTSIVTQVPADGPVAIYNGNYIYNIHSPTMPDNSVRDWTAKNGDNSLRFRYPAGANWAEQRFALNRFYPDLWVSYWIRVPANYARGSSSRNNKWFDIGWGVDKNTDYETDGVRIEMQDWPGSPSVNINLKIQLRQPSPYGFIDSPPYANFVTPADSGRWMNVVYELKSGDGNGIVRLYRRWENESGFTLINEITNAHIITGGNNATGWGYGYFMGWANSTYAQETEWLIDDIVFSTSSLLDLY